MFDFAKRFIKGVVVAIIMFVFVMFLVYKMITVG